MAIRNTYRVPKKTWRKWSATARQVFNGLYRSMMDSPWAFQTQSVQEMGLKRRQWRVTAWNSAWIAADAADGRV
jgi:hypothetical protein